MGRTDPWDSRQRRLPALRQVLTGIRRFRGGGLWVDGIMAAALALGMTAGLLRLASALPKELVTWQFSDVWFHGDLPRAFLKRRDGYSNVTRNAAVHPLFPVLGYLPTRALLSFGLSALQAARVTMALAGGAWIAALYGVLRAVTGRRLDAGVFAALGGVSASAMAWFAVPETWGFGSLTILGALAAAAAARWSPVPEGWHVVVGAATLGTTLTNWTASLCGSFMVLPWRRALRVALYAFCAVLVLMKLQQPLFPASGPFLRFWLGMRGESNFLFQDGGNAWNMTRAFFSHALVFPEIRQMPNDASPWVRLTVQTSHAVGAWSQLAWCSWALLLGFGGWRLLRDARWYVLRWTIFIFLAGQWSLHVVYGGEETFLYSLHWLPVLIVITAFATAGRLRVVGLSLAVMCLGGAVLNNAIRFRQAAQMAHTLTAQPTPQSPEPVNLEPSS